MNYGAARASAKRRKLSKAAATSAFEPEEDLALAETTPASTSSDKKDKRVKPSAIEHKRKTLQIGGLPWKNIVLPSELGFDEDGGLLELDEVEGVQVVYGAGLVTFTVSLPLRMTESSMLTIFC